MDYYFVAKNKEGGFIGQLTLEDIIRKFHSGELSGSYIAARSSGDSYHEVMKSGTATWLTVAELVANPPTPTSLLTQTDATQLLTKQVIALMHRYNDAYLVARVTNGFGGIIKGFGVVIAVLLGLVGVVFVISGRAGDATFAMGVLTIVSGIIVGTLFYIIGILVSAQGQILKASLDSAVNNSPFLTNEHRARIMSLPEV
jgi:hypothetical protein